MSQYSELTNSDPGGTRRYAFLIGCKFVNGEEFLLLGVLIFICKLAKLALEGIPDLEKLYFHAAFMIANYVNFDSIPMPQSLWEYKLWVRLLQERLIWRFLVF